MKRQKRPAGRGRPKNRIAGFTVLEMLMAITIIAVLAGLGVPGYLRIKRQAQSHQCITKLRHLGVGLNLYLGDHGLVMPTLAPSRDDKNDDAVPTIDMVLLEYVDSEDSFRCPSDHEGYWEKTGSSYFWNSLVNGQPMGSMNFMGLTKNQTVIPLMSDKEDFHKHIGDEVNILYADGHVQSELQFTVDP